ncbi:MAG: STN domain-containing protein, partial [Pseudomonadota bacterium]
MTIEVRRTNILLATLLLVFGFVALVCPAIVLAESPGISQSAVKAYAVPAGSLPDALTQFSQQAGVSILFDSSKLQGKVTQGLKGDFEIVRGLEQLLMGSGLQAK